MKSHKTYQLQELIEKIEGVDKMIKLHSSNPSTFMSEQYQAKKEKLLGYLIDQLLEPKYRSPYSFRLIMLALKKFYPEIGQKDIEFLQDDKRYDDLKDLELALA